ncbi:MAG TPA: septal ring lytic transglycosylase RlpA family protein [Stellaceae bacterium]|nr:septal ring lytic transglycosylase RlpA family protein [Stellaceae bacterium]
MRLRKTIGFSLALLCASAPAIAKQSEAGHHHPAPDLKDKHGKADASAARRGAKHNRPAGKTVAARAPGRSLARHRGRSHDAAALPPPDQYIGPYRVVGRPEIGSAAWYGGHHVGQRTASGERLDDIHVTAAHRSLPLHSLVRVTNLRNGRSVIATINDRGPVSRSLVIDVSPRAAEELHMIQSGLAKVSIETVVPAPAVSRQ